MSFEAAVASVRGNKTVLAKPFIISKEGGSLARYSMLKLKRTNFQGSANESLTSS